MNSSNLDSVSPQISQDWLSSNHPHAAATDGELLDIYRYTKSSQAFEEIVRRHSPMVAAVIRRLISNSQDAEDAFQATFLVFVLSAQKIKNPETVRAWLYGVAFRTARRIRRMRRKSNMKVESQTNVGVDLDASASTLEEPLAVIVRELQLEAMDAEISKLPSPIRETIIEFYMGGNTVPEIAKCMNLSVAAVEGRLKRGRKVLRQKLAMRGISLSVVAAACIRFQQDIIAVSSQPWTNRFLELYGNLGASCSNIAQLQETHSTTDQLFQLIKGELAMKTLARSSILMAGGALSLSLLGTLGWVFATSDSPGGVAHTTGHQTAVIVPASDTIPDSTVHHFGNDVLAQMGMGGMGAGGMGGGDMGGMGMGPNRKEVVVPWEKPKTPAPEWLNSEGGSDSGNEKIRALLGQKTDAGYSELPLKQFAKNLADEYGINVILDNTGLAEEGLSPDETISIELRETSLRNVLSLVLKPLDLHYVIDKDCLIITPYSANWGSTRYYDVSFLFPDSGLMTELIATIETSISPNGWQTAGGKSTIQSIGSMLVVKADEEAYLEIEDLLKAISKQPAANLKPRTFIDTTPKPAAIESKPAAVDSKK